MDVFELRKRLVEDYESYVRSFIRIKDAPIEEEVKENLDEGLLWPDPLIQLNPSFETGDRIDGLVLLLDAAHELGQTKLTRKVCRALNQALNAEHNAGRLRTDWQLVWKPRKK